MHACIGEGNGNPLQYSCLENPRDRVAWRATVHGVSQSRTRPESDFPSYRVFKDSDHISIAFISRKHGRERSVPSRKPSCIMVPWRTSEVGQAPIQKAVRFPQSLSVPITEGISVWLSLDEKAAAYLGP